MKKWGTRYTMSVVCVILSGAIAAFWTMAHFIEKVVNQSPTQCTTFCSNPVTNFSSLNQLSTDGILAGAYAILTLIAALITTVVSSIWALVLFKATVKTLV